MKKNCYSSQKEIQVEDYLAPEDKGEYLFFLIDGFCRC